MDNNVHSQKHTKNFFTEFICILLVMIIIASSITCAAAFWGVIDIPFISNTLNNGDSPEFAELTGGFTDITVKDEESATDAAREAAEQMGCKSEAKELTVAAENKVGNLTYYRFQQNYNGIPVYGKTLSLTVNAKGRVLSSTSNLVSEIDVETNTDLDTFDFESGVKEYLDKYYDDAEIKSVSAPNENDLMIYDFGKGDGNVLAVDIDILFSRNGSDIRTSVIYDLTNDEAHPPRETVNAQNIVCYGKTNKTESFNGLYTNGSYIMKDTSRNIYILNAEGKTYYDAGLRECNTEIPQLVSSSDIYFGNEDDDGKNYDRAYEFLKKVSKVYDFYAKNYNDISLGNFVGIYDDKLGEENGNNAYGGTGSLKEIDVSLPEYREKNKGTKYEGAFGSVMLGTEHSTNISEELLGHEYTHVITRKNVDWNGDMTTEYNIPGAINEGYSDIFGEIIEAKLTKKEPDWKAGNRIICDPSENSYPEKADDDRKIYPNYDENGNVVAYCCTVKNNSGNTYATDYAHAFSTVVSHAAYLMTVDGKKGTALTVDELANLWYNAMHSLPADCTYTVLRKCIEITADNLGYGEDKKERITSAFDKVGIESQEEKETYSPDATLSVFDGNGEYYDNYKIKITGKKYTGLKTGLRKKDFSKKIDVNDDSPVSLNLTKGDYKITVTDKSDGEKEVSKQIKIRDDSENKKIFLATDFKKSKTADKSDTSAKDNTAAANQKPKTHTTKVKADYSEVINQYKETITNDFYRNSQDYDEAGEFVSSLLLQHAGYEKSGDYRVYYALIDINKDGTDELVIGGKGDYELAKYDIFTYDGKKPVPLLDIGVYGERNTFTLYDNGNVYTFGAGGANYSSFDYYSLPKNSTKLKFVAGFCLDCWDSTWSEYDGEKYYITDDNGNKLSRIDESEYNKKRQKYISDEYTLSWKEIVAEKTTEETKPATTESSTAKVKRENETAKSSTSLIATNKDFSNFEEMLRETFCMDFDNNFDLNSIDVKDVLGRYLTGGGIPNGTYTYFYGSTVEYNENAKGYETSYLAEDPEGRFFTAYKLEAKKADWIIKNVFEKTPDRSLSGESYYNETQNAHYYGYYYKGNYLYISGELGGGPGIDCEITEKYRLSDGTYGIGVSQWTDNGISSDVDTCYYVCKLKEDGTMGRYWTILKGSSNKRCYSIPATSKKSGTSTEQLFYDYIKKNLTLCKKFPSSDGSSEGVFSALVRDFDNDNQKEMVTFSLTYGKTQQPYILLDLYTIKNNAVVHSDTSEEILATGSGNYQSNLCGIYEDSLIKIQHDAANFGGSSIVKTFMSYKVNNGKLKLCNHFSFYEFYRYDTYTYEEKVSGKTFSSSDDFNVAVSKAGFDRKAHLHVGYGDSEFDITRDDYKTAKCFKGNHIFTIFDNIAMVTTERTGFIHDNTELADKI